MDNLLSRHFISLFLIFLFAVHLGSQRSARDKELRYFWLTVISCFFLVLEDQFETAASLDPALRTWRTFLSVAGYVLRSTATLGLALVVCEPESRSRSLLWIPCAVNALVCSTAFFTDLVFGFDENYSFYRGPLGYVPFIIPLFYLAVILFLTFRRYVDRSQRTDRLILITCAVLCLLSALLDATRGGVRLHEAIMISCIFFYVFLRSYDVRKDSLTGVLNRQSLYDDCRSQKKNICAAASVDMNGLKDLNDSQGHQAGDSALRRIGACLRETAGPDVRCYRTGGDEFILLFFRGDEAAVRGTLERMRDRIAAAGYSIAWGYAMREGEDDPYLMIRRSDLKMFENKAKYYQDQRHDRRRNRRESDRRVPAESRKAVEELTQPFAVYRFTDHRAEILAVSDGFCRLFGYPDREQALHVLDRDMYGDVHPDDQDRLSAAMLRFADGREDLDVVYRTSAGMPADFRVVHARGVRVHTENGDRVAHVWYMDEGVYVEGDESSGSLMTQALNRALHEESILNASHYDELTSLPSLAWFFQLCEAQKTRVLREGKESVLLYIDLSGMKYFNDRFGFSEGDQLLKSFAALLLELFGKENTCHIAADHFAACTVSDDLEDRLRALFAAAEKINSGNSLPVRVGIYVTGSGETSVSSAFDRAKLACDSIRRSDASAFQRYTREMSEAFRRRQYIIANIDTAVRERWIRAYYQPIVRSSDAVLCDEEALARWIDPVEGFLSPAEFVPHLEATGLNYKLDLCILDQVIEKITARRQAGLPVIPQSVNLSRSDFDACDIVEEIRSRVDAAAIPHDLISVEITESVIAKDFDYINAQVKRFREAGFAVWMDDFGSGYSSLDVLQSIQFDLIKFDMSFLRKLDEGENGKIILRELVKLASKLHLDTVCEGVEKEDHVLFLREIGCHKLQGYFFGKPAPYVQEQAAANVQEQTETPD